MTKTILTISDIRAQKTPAGVGTESLAVGEDFLPRVGTTPPPCFLESLKRLALELDVFKVMICVPGFYSFNVLTINLGNQETYTASEFLKMSSGDVTSWSLAALCFYLRAMQLQAAKRSKAAVRRHRACSRKAPHPKYLAQGTKSDFLLLGIHELSGCIICSEIRQRILLG
ncbi:hypothetical protein LI328DRAFT_159837 [Trichoderma asperelloides]|nr:hypothetical protein LI328DRAFT_159837 [Trichoderma asperelloides]